MNNKKYEMFYKKIEENYLKKLKNLQKNYIYCYYYNKH